MSKEEKITEEIQELEKKELKYFFNHIEFLEFNDEEKEKVAKCISESSSWWALYWWQILLSAIIWTLWLLQDSTVVVIWAMLISPISKSINWLWYGIAKWWNKIFSESLKILLISIILVIFTWFFITKIIGLNLETEEILSRVNPNIIDFFIAIFSSIVAVLWIKYDKLWNSSVVWVALSVALLLPLSVIGIEFAIWNFYNSFWAFMLFAANLFAVLIVTSIFFWLYWFVPHGIKMQEKSFKRLALVLCFIALILIPLVISFNVMKTNNEISAKIYTCLQEIIWEEAIFYDLWDIKVLENTENKLKIATIIRVPEWYKFENISNEVLAVLSEEFDKKIVLDLDVIRFVTVELE